MSVSNFSKFRTNRAAPYFRLPSRQSDGLRRSLPRAFTFLLVASLGVYFITASHAATFATSQEAESGALSGPSAVVGDSNASGGKAVVFGSKAVVSVAKTFPACITSGATGAGTPSKVVTVGAPSGDMTSAIKSALNSAGGGGKVVLRSGTYTISSTLTVPPGVDFTGAGESATTVLASSTANVDPMITTGSNSNITIENMTVNQNGESAASSQNLSSYMVETRGTNEIIQNVATRDPSTYSVATVGANKFCIRDNNVLQDPAENGKYNQLDGIHILSSSNGDILNNYVDNSYDGATDGDDALVAHAYGGPVSNVRYQGNVVRGGQNGVGIAIWDYDDNISGLTITGNEIWGEEGIGHGNGYSGDTGDFSNSTITGNNIHNNNSGISLGANSVTVSGNRLCSSGSVSVSGSGNSVSNNSTYAGCANAPTTQTPPPVIP